MYEKLAKTISETINKDCIVVTTRYETDRYGNQVPYGLTVLAETRKNLGHSRGKYTCYDYGFMQLDTEAGISVIIV